MQLDKSSLVSVMRADIDEEAQTVEALSNFVSLRANACVLSGEWGENSHVNVCARERECVCVCVCVCMREVE